jgi:hypothetical protein
MISQSAETIFLGFKVITVVDMKSTIFWDMKSYSQLKGN